MKRVFTGFALAVIALAAVLFAAPPLFALLLVVLGMLAVRELYDLAEASGVRPYRYIGFVAATAVILSTALPWTGMATSPWLGLDKILIACLLAVLVRALCQPDRGAGALADASVTLFALLYPALLIGLMGAVRQYGAPWLILLFAVVWLGDVAALYFGRAFGTHPMAPQVSPNKTWEGAAASALAAILTGCGLGFWWNLEASRGTFARLLLLAGLSLAINVAAQVGDLVESLFKRGAQIKDSGTLLPGHGGVLDRLDALLFAIPVIWYYLSFHI